VAVDVNFRVHVVWESADRVYHSQAHARGADNARAWAAPALLATQASHPAVTSLPDGSLHVLYFRYDTNGGVYHLGSEDGGLSWSSPTLVYAPAATGRTQTLNDMTQIVPQGNETLHAVWTDILTPTPDRYGEGIFYARSDDRGESWGIPIRLDDDWAELGDPELPDWLVSLTIDGSGGLHALWSATYGQGPSCARWERSSADGGRTWGQRRRVLSPLEGCLGWMNAAVDAAGTTHLVTIARDGIGGQDGHTGLFHSRWRGADWTAPLPVASVSGSNRDWEAAGVDVSHMAIGLGNRLHVVWHRHGSGVWYLQGESDAPPAEPLPVAEQALAPTPVAPPSSEGSPAAGPTAEPTPRPLLSAERPSAPLLSPLWLGLIPSAAIVLGAVLLNRRRRRRE
jgi:hypothetical protein